MDDLALKDILISLKEIDPLFLRVVYFKCSTQLAHPKIADALKISDNGLYQKDRQIKNIFATHKIDYPSPVIGRALAKYFTPSPNFNLKPDSVTSRPSPRPPESSPKPPDGSNWLEDATQPEKQSNSHSTIPLFLAGLLLIGIVLGGWFFRIPAWLWGERGEEVAERGVVASEPVERVVEVTRLIEVERLVTVPPIESTRVVEIINTVVVPQEVIVTALATVEVPVTVEVTSAPTPLPTPIERSVYEENFDDGRIDPAFTVEGNPQFVNGIMQGPGVVISIGDETWKNYSIKFDFGGLGFGWGIIMTVRDKDGTYLKYNNGGGTNTHRGSWQYVRLNESSGFAGTQMDHGGKMDVLIEDDQIIQTGDGATIVFTNTISDSGKITILLGRTWIDNLVITRLD